MKSKNFIFIFIALIIISFQHTNAQTPVLSEKAEISLLTNSPWDKEVYAIFGHTAIRVNDSINNLDVAFNYGTFDFDSPNFIYRFVKGETDYWLSLTDFKNYIYSYSARGVGITEQVLNLSQTEKQNLFDALVINSLPENTVYRYNYFYDNCTTRSQNIITNNVNGTIEYKPYSERLTFRNLLHIHLQNNEWLKFGIDLVIGADADKPINDRLKDFLPVTLKKSFDSAIIKGQSGETKSLIKETNELSKPSFQKNETNILGTPLAIGILLLFVTIVISYFNLQDRFLFLGRIYDTILFFIAGIIGCIIFFLMYFSIHPCTNPNWNLVWLNPLQLIFSFLFFIKSLTKFTYYYHFINFVLLSLLFLVWFLIPQHLELAFLPFIITLWMRSGVNIIKYKRTK